MSYVKTESGQAAFRERSALFSARQRAAYILFDGVKSADQVLAATVGLGVTRLDIEQMASHGFLKENDTSDTPAVAVAPAVAVPHAPAVAPAPVFAPTLGPGALPVSTRTPQERYSKAKPLATQLTASLGLRGFLLNLGVESASGYDDLLALFPKIQAAVGAKKCEALERALKG
jgi:hypothetical protein